MNKIIQECFNQALSIGRPREQNEVKKRHFRHPLSGNPSMTNDNKMNFIANHIKIDDIFLWTFTLWLSLVPSNIKLIFYQPAKIGNNWFSTRPFVILHVHHFVFSSWLCKHFFVSISTQLCEHFLDFFTTVAKRKVTKKKFQNEWNFLLFTVSYYTPAILKFLPKYASRFDFHVTFFIISCTKILNFPYFSQMFFHMCWLVGFSLIFRLLFRFYLLYIAEFENEMKIKKTFFFLPSSMKNAAQFFSLLGSLLFPRVQLE